MTTYELKQTLRELTFGLPRVATTGLKKHELQGLVSYYRSKAKDVASHMTYPPAKTGPQGPREVPVEDEEVDGLTVGVPKPPAPKVKRTPLPEGDPRKMAPGPGRPKKAPPADDGMIAVPLIKGKSEKAFYCRGSCSCPNCPKKK